MKNYSNYLIIISLIFLGLYSINSCQKTDSKLLNESENMEKITKETPVIIYLDCIGGRNDASMECYVRVMPGSISCSCEGSCAMEVSKNPKGAQIKIKTDWTPIYAYFLDYIERKHGVQNHKVTSFVQTVDPDYELIQMEYTIEGHSNTYSLMFVSNIKNNKSTGLTLVDCTGSCGSSKEKCVESYNPSTGVISCGCEGPDCQMTVEHIE